jgi:hypothetical protein
MLAPSRGLWNRSGEPARWMEKIGTGLNMERVAPSKSGFSPPSPPIVTVQSPDTDGRNGSTEVGDGSVMTGCAKAANGKAIVKMRATK